MYTTAVTQSVPNVLALRTDESLNALKFKLTEAAKILCITLVELKNNFLKSQINKNGNIYLLIKKWIND